MEIWIRTTVIALVIHLFVVPPVWAALGQSIASIERDRAAMGGQARSSFGKGYSIETITVAGMTINEYMLPDGVVFAVTWKGTGTPNLPLLFGTYFDEYTEGITAHRKSRPRTRKHLTMKTTHLVVERGGHSRFMWGRAFIPALLPSAISPQDIR